MAFNRYYQDELLYLRDMGREFAQVNPQAAPFLESAGQDPDVERLLEGFAFLTGRIRQKIDDELPELTNALLAHFWPHYLRPLPAMTILQFASHGPGGPELRRIEAGAYVDSIPVEGTRCTFRTSQPVQVQPLVMSAVSLQREAPQSLSLRLQARPGASFDSPMGDDLRLFLGGEAAVSRSCYLLLCGLAQGLVLRDPRDGSRLAELGAGAIKPLGFDPAEALLAWPEGSFDGYRILQEYFAFPQRLLFVELRGVLARLRGRGLREVEVQIPLSAVPESMPSLEPGHFFLNCTPAVNLFDSDADPIRIDPARSEYRVRPSGANPAHYEIHELRRVEGMQRGRSHNRVYRPLMRLGRFVDQDRAFYREHRRPALIGDGADVFLSFVRLDDDEDESEETITLACTCSNRSLPAQLANGDIREAHARSPGLPSFRNITRPSASVPPPLDGDNTWRLLAHLSLNMASLHQLEAFKALLDVYNFPATHDRQARQVHRRQLAGLTGLTSRAATRMLDGCPLRGVELTLQVDEDHFASDGELYLFASVLQQFLGQYVSLNSFSQLHVTGTRYGTLFSWPPRLGRREVV